MTCETCFWDAHRRVAERGGAWIIWYHVLVLMPEHERHVDRRPVVAGEAS